LIESAIKKWDLNYLKIHLKNSAYNVYRSKTKNFLYWDDKKVGDFKDFKPPTDLLQMNFNEFVDKIQEKDPNNNHRYLLCIINI
jgi:hypoxia-inducible factor 1-alpha inhibitor (HIF hydroxylase)